VKFLSKKLENRPIPVGLSIHFLFWWSLSVWFWAQNFGSYIGLYFAPIAPIYLGITGLASPGNLEAGVAGVLIFFTVLGSMLLAVRKRSRWTVFLTHVAVLLYWFIGFALMSPVP
jgi:hypothetical protein